MKQGFHVLFTNTCLVATDVVNNHTCRCWMVQDKPSLLDMYND